MYITFVKSGDVFAQASADPNQSWASEAPSRVGLVQSMTQTARKESAENPEVNRLDRIEMSIAMYRYSMIQYRLI